MVIDLAHEAKRSRAAEHRFLLQYIGKRFVLSDASISRSIYLRIGARLKRLAVSRSQGRSYIEAEVKPGRTRVRVKFSLHDDFAAALMFVTGIAIKHLSFPSGQV